MADQADAEDDDLFEDDAQEADIDDQDGDQDQDDGSADDEEEFTEIAFGDGATPAPSEKPDSELVRKLRAEIRDRDARLRQLQAKSQPVEVEDPGPKPTLESCGFDEEQFETALDAWKDRKAKAEQAESQAQKDAESAQAAFQEDLTRFRTQKAALKVRDYEGAEAEVGAALADAQKAVLVQAAENSAAVIYALGKHPDRLKQLAAITNPIKLAVAVSKLERDLKVTTKRRAPEPEGTVRGSASPSAGTDKHLERLEREADRSGDRSKVIAYKREQRARGKS